MFPIIPVLISRSLLCLVPSSVVVDLLVICTKAFAYHSVSRSTQCCPFLPSYVTQCAGPGRRGIPTDRQCGSDKRSLYGQKPNPAAAKYMRSERADRTRQSTICGRQRTAKGRILFSLLASRRLVKIIGPPSPTCDVFLPPVHTSHIGRDNRHSFCYAVRRMELLSTMWTSTLLLLARSDVGPVLPARPHCRSA